MINRLQVTIDVIIHATEDISKFITSFEKIFGLTEDDFMIQHLTGHYENPIILMTSKMAKKQANEFLRKLLSFFSKNQLEEIIDDLENRVDNSTLHIRLNKQELIKGKIDFKEKDPIKLKISTPIYNKKDTRKIFSNILLQSN